MPEDQQQVMLHLFYVWQFVEANKYREYAPVEWFTRAITRGRSNQFQHIIIALLLSTGRRRPCCRGTQKWWQL